MKLIKFLLIMVLFTLNIFTLFSRDIRIIVIDADLDYPLEGALVRTREGAEYECDEDGAAVLQIPDGRQIILNTYYPGYEPGVITIPVTGNTFTIGMHLSGILHGSELIIEASMPGSSETRTGRSVAVTSREISQTGEIGIIEDVMSTIKLLPGVNYSGMFSSQPSIRGGYPGDMISSMDGYTINNPYFWGGGFSIFDPRMVQSAQLSHGVFPVRYGHTISGLLEITTKKPSPTETLFELGVNTSAANLSLSIPLQKGGIIIMGRVTYYDPVIWLAQELSKEIEILEAVNYIRQAPYIRTATISGNYRFTNNLELSATAFWGMDGVGVLFENSSNSDILTSISSIVFDFKNYQGFLTAALSWNPRNNMLFRFTAGTGYEDSDIKGDINYEIVNIKFSNSFLEKYSNLIDGIYYEYYEHNKIDQSDLAVNIQGRIDFDMEISRNFLISAGVQELYSYSSSKGMQQMFYDTPFSNIKDETLIKNLENLFLLLPFNMPDNLIVVMPLIYTPDSGNHLLTTSGFVLGEYISDNSRIKAELGVRLDHFILFGDGFTLKSDVVLNPRFNIDFNIFKNVSFINSFDISAGTGLFSSVNSAVFDAEKEYNLDYMKPNRSWTSILGLRFEFPGDLSLNIEGYYKYVFDRMYIPVNTSSASPVVSPFYDGIGHIWGIDVMLHKIQSRFWDGWLSYSYNWSKYRDPNGVMGGTGISGGNRGSDWYFPHYHRFHNLNLVLNLKPVQNINIYFRFGVASGIPLSRRDENGPQSYPVLVYNEDDPIKSYFIEKYRWRSYLDPNRRTTPSLPMDLKISFFGGNPSGKTRWEIYIAAENLLSLVYTAQGNTSFNPYTGQVDTGSSSASYEIPIPIPSFGFKISY